MRFPFLPLQQRRKEDFVGWAREHAVFFDKPDGLHADIEQLSCLDKLLEGKRIVYLGEEDHWIHEKYGYRLLMLRYLLSRGWNCIGEELGWSDGLRVGRYFQTGDEANLERIATFGYRGDERAEREDKPTGILKDSALHYPAQAFQAEHIRFVRALRGVRNGESLRYFGFDINAAAGGGYADIVELLSESPQTEALQTLRDMLKQVEGETLERERERLQRCCSFAENSRQELSKALGGARFAELRQNIAVLRDSVDFYSLAHPAKAYKALNIAMAAREEAMLRNVKHVLSQMKSDDKLVLMGHNRHLCRNGERIAQTGATPGGGKTSALGTAIARICPAEVFAVWMLNEKGTSAQPFSSLKKEYGRRGDTLNTLLAAVGASYFLPFDNDPRAALLRRNFRIAGLYDTIFCTKMAEQADALFFVREVSPLTVF